VGRAFESPQARQSNAECGMWNAGSGERKFRTPHFEFRIGDGPLAQLVEQLTLNQRVAGSSPARPTKINPLRLDMLKQIFHCYYFCF
jgi:hypothetical protein